ncbi:beta-ketoacyl synthase N-terminal-like domain-containing protein [Desulfuromonas thiophila]|uniref:beta-ketoacyl synthase N-terminal-like domain-containing protein n=1 Tax=Desulfuromonas thiophila TaxID=57664 RepID=UPI0024A85562|nr:beta-ketoacyl synthase N-terminal-like domain-containing protein [Desulfuromonas thiophila]
MISAHSVAIVGIGGLFPEAPTLEHFWQLIHNGESVASEPPAGRWPLSLEDYYHPDKGRPDALYSRRACFIRDELLQLPLDSLQIDPALPAHLDPLFQLVLIAGSQAFFDARVSTQQRQRAGVILGNLALPSVTTSQLAWDYLGRSLAEQLLGQVPPAHKPDARNRFMTGLPAALLAKALGLGGRCFTLDAACASSLYAIKLAVEELRSGRADLMLAGGVARPDSLYTQMGFSQLRALSPRGICAPFDRQGDGLVVGEGAGLLVLKRTVDALRDGDRIYATIAAIGLSNDIGGSLLAPSSAGQLRAMRAAYASAGWQPQDVDHIECHATGTPVGDAVECASLQALWGNHSQRRCVLGAVKANIGHLLTAAGAAAVIKTLLALKHQTLPPTANFCEPLAPLVEPGTPFEVLRQPRPWPQPSDHPRRAAVSAFGFGGINAHLLLEEGLELQKRSGRGATTVPQPAAQAPEPIAIIGLNVELGPWQTVAALRQQLFAETEQTTALPTSPQHWGGAPQRRWWQQEGFSPCQGHYLADLQLNAGQFRIPPTEMAEMLPRQALMLRCAAAVLATTGCDQTNHERTGVFIGTGLDLAATSFSLRWSLPLLLQQARQQGHLSDTQADDPALLTQLRDALCPPLTANRTMGALGSVVASRIARAFGVGGPSFTLASEENSGLQALQSATGALQRGEIDLALVGAVDLPGDIRAQLSNQQLGRTAPISEGACALVLQRLSDAQASGATIFALIEAETAATAATADLLGITDALPQKCLAALQTQLRLPALTADSFGLRLASGPDSPTDPARESLMAIPLTARYGQAGEASGLLAVLCGALALHHRLLPSQGDCRPRYWLHNAVEGPRRALISGTATGGQCQLLVLREAPAPSDSAHRLPPAQPLALPGPALFICRASNAAALAENLQQLAQRLQDSPQQPLNERAAHWWHSQPAAAVAPCCLSLLADSPAELAEQLHFAQQHLRHQPTQRLDGRTAVGRPACSRGKLFYAPQPLAGEGAKLAFVFPGSGNHFNDMGRQLGLCWPGVFEAQHRQNQRLRDQYQPDNFWCACDPAVIEQDHNCLIIAHVALCTALSDTVRQFGVQPQLAIGYSLGESSSLFSLGFWQERDAMLERIEASPLFSRQLAGPCEAARQLWQLPATEAVDWCLGVVPRPAQRVRGALAGLERAYLLIINTPDECVIGGQRQSVQQLVARLADKRPCPFIELRGVTTVHCPVAGVVADAYRALHLFDTQPQPGLSLYSCASGQPYEATTEQCAGAILAQATDTIDFTRVIERAYADGARLFIETGSGNSCSRMIGRILGQRPHLALPTCVRGQTPQQSFGRLLAQLLAEGYPCDPSLFFPAPAQPSAPPVPAGPPVILRHGLGDIRLPALAQRTVSAQNATKSPGASLPATTVAPPQGLTETALSPALRQSLLRTQQHQSAAHSRFLQLSQQLLQLSSQQLARQPVTVAPSQPSVPGRNLPPTPPPVSVSAPEAPRFDRRQCLEFAIGSIGTMLGERFAAIDRHPTRVRLPDEPLMLVDRILTLEGEPCSLSQGRVVTEHDVTADRWYLDSGRIPTCVAVEAGQADLFLSAWLGIDFQTRGLAVYRLLDAVVRFHGPLPGPGAVIRYDIRIERFFRQGDTWLFRFAFDSTVDGRPLLTMRNGCAGFFSQTELNAGRGIIQTALDLRPQTGKRPADWRELVPLALEQYDSQQLQALRQGDLAGCFGSAFAHLPLQRPLGLPGGKLELVDRVTRLDPAGGRFGLGQIRAEMDVQPDDWFLTCHFCDDQVMPGTLMYECCLHCLRLYLMRLGWVCEQDEAVWEPVAGMDSQLKCRGQVTASTRTVTYEVSLKELGYNPAPYAIVDALMYADGKAIVEIGNMSVQLSGMTREVLEQRWQQARVTSPAPRPATTTADGRKPALYDYDRILAFSAGKPSEAFGEPYRIFDAERRIARLPRPPFQFLDRITVIAAEPWRMVAGGHIEAQYDVPADAWYFAANRSRQMPFCVLLEIALQPCGWLAAYVGSALTSPVDLCFRNLDGTARQLRPVDRNSGTLTTQVTLTRVSSSGGMIIQGYDFCVHDQQGPVYQGETLFGFFTAAALANQVGLRTAQPCLVSAKEQASGAPFDYPSQPPFPDQQLRMLDRIELFCPAGGPAGAGWIRGSKQVDPQEWFFAAHFYQDPVCPGSLGLESFLQLLRVIAAHHWGEEAAGNLQLTSAPHQWSYRGQIIPTNRQVRVEACIEALDHQRQELCASGLLSVDGKIIYQMQQFHCHCQPPVSVGGRNSRAGEADAS